MIERCGSLKEYDIKYKKREREREREREKRERERERKGGGVCKKVEGVSGGG